MTINQQKVLKAMHQNYHQPASLKDRKLQKKVNFDIVEYPEKVKLAKEIRFH
jgi:hypothetical protein